MEAVMNSVTYKVPNISCGHCVNTIQMEVGELDGVISVKADATTKEAVINFQEPATEEQLKGLLAELNYPVEK
jgi:copper chaperone CopZ